MADTHIKLLVWSVMHAILIATVNSTFINQDQQDEGASCKMYNSSKRENINKNELPGLDCSYRNLVSIPHWLDNMPLILKLNNNKLDNITGSPFKVLILLQVLDLSFSEISYLTANVFNGLSQLNVLLLGHNKIRILSDGIFSDLNNLKTLVLSYNLLDTIPIALPQSLHVLGLDGNYFTSFRLGQDFLKMRNLSFLDIANASPSLRDNITNETFQYLNAAPEANLALYLIWFPYIPTTSVGTLRNVKELLLVAQPLDHFQSTECPLETLTISYYGGRTELEPLLDLVKWNSSLTRLTLSNGFIESINSPVFTMVPLLQKLEITQQSLQFISDDAFDGLEHLEELILSQNNLQTVPSNALRVFMKHATLKFLDLSYNKIGGTIPADAFAAVPFLTSLNMAGNYRINLQRDWTAILVNLTELNLDKTGIYLYPVQKIPSLKTLLLRMSSQKEAPKNMGMPICSIAHLIQKVLLTNYQPFRIKLLAAFIGIECLHLKELGISGCFAYSNAFLTKQKIINLPNLNILVTARNKIKSIAQLMFIRAPQLAELDLSYNEIQTIEDDNLFFLHKLKHLNLEGNKLVSLSGVQQFSLMKTLLAPLNQITTVPKSLLRKSYESGLKTLDLGGNPFDCTCDIMLFKKWMAEDNTTWLVPNQFYICASPDNMKGRSINNVDLDCRSRLLIYLGSGLSCALLSIIVAFVVVQYRWHLKYQWFLFFRYKRIKKGVNANQNAALNEDIHYPAYDAYIAYAEDSPEDEHWVINDLRQNLEEGPEPFQLCIKGRDFIPGDTIVDAISECIQRSTKTILILSPHFIESEWCYFEMQMARMRLFHENHDVLIMIMLRQIPNNKLTLSLRQLLCKQDYFKWPADNLGKNLFWRRLREEIKKPVRVDRRVFI